MVEDRAEMSNVEIKIDKTFLIAKPRRKVSWTKCFAAGGGSVDGWGGMVVARRVAGMVGWPEYVGFEAAGAQHFRGRVLGC